MIFDEGYLNVPIMNKENKLEKLLNTLNKNMTPEEFTKCLRDGFSVILRHFSDPDNFCLSDIDTVVEIVKLVVMKSTPNNNYKSLVDNLFSTICIAIAINAKDNEYIDRYYRGINKSTEVFNDLINKGIHKYEFLDITRDISLGFSDMMHAKEKFNVALDEHYIDLSKESKSLIDLQCSIMALNNEQIYDLFVKEDDATSSLLSEESVVDKAKVATLSVKKAVTDKEKSMDRWFQSTFKSIRNSRRNSVREGLVEDNIPKLSKLVRRAIVVGAAWAISPALAAITFCVQKAVGKAGEAKERTRLLRELKQELAITEEKIKDADSESDKAKKYQLMRCKQKIQTNIDKLKHYII